MSSYGMADDVPDFLFLPLQFQESLQHHIGVNFEFIVEMLLNALSKLFRRTVDFEVALRVRMVTWYLLMELSDSLLGSKKSSPCYFLAALIN